MEYTGKLYAKIGGKSSLSMQIAYQNVLNLITPTTFLEIELALNPNITIEEAQKNVDNLTIIEKDEKKI
jgi:hypothetical protein